MLNAAIVSIRRYADAVVIVKPTGVIVILNDREGVNPRTQNRCAGVM
jgi:hypothetical protein